MFYIHHKIFENKVITKDERREETRDAFDVVELQLVKILNELKEKKLIHPDTPMIDESIALVLHDIRNFRFKYTEKRYILAGDNFYEYRINPENNHFHFYKKRDGGKYISIRDYYED